MFYIHDGRKRVALTIDDGPSPEYTPQVLRLLEKYRVTATFSMIGLEAAAYPGLVREVAAAGHKIANHTWSHLDLVYLRDRSQTVAALKIVLPRLLDAGYRFATP
jgi:peptidoglycan/xylan/chitin deacetylase (PgdA/CDA1 family)